MGMSVVEFMKRKNEIVKAVTGVILVPEDQIIDIPEDKRKPLDLDDDLSEYDFLGTGYCPYCALYFDDGCEGCPMFEADNDCNQDNNGTWAKANKIWTEISTKKDWKKLRDLVTEYNKQFENSEEINNLELDTDNSTITGTGKGEPTGDDNSVQCADAQRYYDEIIKISESLENRFSENKARIKNYETASNTLSMTKRSVASAKENYSDKEKKWFEEFSKI